MEEKEKNTTTKGEEKDTKAPDIDINTVTENERLRAELASVRQEFDNYKAEQAKKEIESVNLIFDQMGIEEKYRKDIQILAKAKGYDNAKLIEELKNEQGEFALYNGKKEINPTINPPSDKNSGDNSQEIKYNYNEFKDRFI